MAGSDRQYYKVNRREHVGQEIGARSREKSADLVGIGGIGGIGRIGEGVRDPRRYFAGNIYRRRIGRK